MQHELFCLDDPEVETITLFEKGKLKQAACPKCGKFVEGDKASFMYTWLLDSFEGQSAREQFPELIREVYDREWAPHTPMARPDWMFEIRRLPRGKEGNPNSAHKDFKKKTDERKN